MKPEVPEMLAAMRLVAKTSGKVKATGMAQLAVAMKNKSATDFFLELNKLEREYQRNCANYEKTRLAEGKNAKVEIIDRPPNVVGVYLKEDDAGTQECIDMALEMLKEYGENDVLKEKP